MDRAAARRRGDVRPEGLGDLGDHPRLLRGAGLPDRRRRSTAPTSCRSTALLDGTHRHRLELAAGVARRAAPIRRHLPRHRDARHRSRPRLVPRRAPRAGPCERSPTCAAGRWRSARSDSPQATLIPLGRLRRDGLEPGRDFTVRRFDVLVGKHGDHIGGERDAFECAAAAARRDACAMLDLNWDGWTTDGTIDADQFAIVADDRPLRSLRLHGPRRISTPTRSGAGSRRCSRCATTIPTHREMMDLEGLKAWLPGRTSGFGAARRRPSTRSGSSTRPRASVSALPLFPVTTVGSWPRPPALLARSGSCAAASIDRAEFDRVADAAVRRAAAAAGGGRLRHRHRRRAAARQLLFVRRREARRRAADDAGRDARRRRGQGRVRAAAADARRAGLLDQQPDLRRARSRGASRWPSTISGSCKRHTDRPVKVTLPGPVPADARDVRARGDAARSIRPRKTLGRRRRARCCATRSPSWRRRAPTSSSSTSRC